MRLILKEDVPKLGDAGDVVTVRPGYGRNYLIPKGKALLATEDRIRQLEHQKRMIDDRQRKEIGAHEAVARSLAGIELSFEVQVGEEGKLFGSVTNSDIQHRLAERGFELERRRIQLPEPIKQVGDYEVTIRLHREVQTEIKVSVVPAPE
jgi:large subunit ribosomal protein L9